MLNLKQVHEAVGGTLVVASRKSKKAKYDQFIKIIIKAKALDENDPKRAALLSQAKKLADALTEIPDKLQREAKDYILGLVNGMSLEDRVRRYSNKLLTGEEY